MSAFENKMKETANSIRNKTGNTEKIKINNFPTEIDSISTESNKELTPEKIYAETRPTDWLEMPAVNDNELYLLFQVFDGIDNLIAFTATCTGNYTVELGTVVNGSFVANSEKTVNLASGEKYENDLSFADWGDLTSKGAKQVMIKISGTDITYFETSTHTKKIIPQNYNSWRIVEIRCKLTKGTGMNFGAAQFGNAYSLIYLKYFSWEGTNNLTDATQFFEDLTSLITVLNFDTSKVTNMQKMFYYCTSLKVLPELNTVNVTNMSMIFSECYSLVRVPNLNTSNVTKMGSAFSGCYSLTSIPQLDTSNVIYINGLFNNCFSLTTIPQLNLLKINSLDSIFEGCKSIEYVEINAPNAESASYLFKECRNLKKVVFTGPTKADFVDEMFMSCVALNSILNLDLSHATFTDNMFKINYALSELTFYPAESWTNDWRGTNISLKNCNFNHQKLVELINELPTLVTERTLELTGNPGVSELTDEEKLVATNKKWALTL